MNCFARKAPKLSWNLQQRFVREYLAALLQGTMTLVNAIRSAADNG